MIYNAAYCLVRVFTGLVYRLSITGRELIPKGGALICSNHPHASDPFFIGLALGKKDRPVIMAKSELFKMPLLAKILTSFGAFPIQRGHSDVKAVKLALEKLREGKKLMIFPEGHRVREGEEQKAKSGTAFLAVKSACPVVPVYITPGRKPFINRVRVTVGEPFYLDAGLSYKELADNVVKAIYEIENAAVMKNADVMKKIE